MPEAAENPSKLTFQDSRDASLAGIALVAMGLMTLAVAETLSNPALNNAGWISALDVFVIGVTVATGVYARRRTPANNFGTLLILSGLLWGIAALTAATSPALHSVGRVAQWPAELTILYLVLSYPTGSLKTRGARVVFYAGVAVVVLLYVPTIFFVSSFDHPFPLESCASSCPSNAFMLSASEPGVIGNVISPLRDILASAVYAAAIGVLALRLRSTSPALRWTLAPVLAAGILRLLLAGAFQLAQHWGSAATTLALGRMSVIALPALSLGFMWGLINWRLLEARSLERLTGRLTRRMDQAELQDAVAEALHDPTVELLLGEKSTPTGWQDIDSRPVESPSPTAARAVLLAPSRNPEVAILYDDTANVPHGFVESIGACVIASLEQMRLKAALQGSLREVHESRFRIAAAADRGRRRLERDLHDSAQQQLIALRIQLELAAENTDGSPAQRAERLRNLGKSVDEVLDGIRSLARGVYPPLLADAGLVEALEMAAIRSPIPAEVTAEDIGRYPPEIESAIYFSCLEALQNVAKHADGATGVSISLVDGTNLRFEVDDDGAGFEANGNRSGAGLTNMRDRLAAVGGTLEIDSSPGAGAKVRGVVPTRSHSSNGSGT